MLVENFKSKAQSGLKFKKACFGSGLKMSSSFQLETRVRLPAEITSEFAISHPAPAPALSAEPGAVVALPHLARSRLARMDVFTSSLSLLASSHVRSTIWTLGGKLLHQTTSKNSQKINFAL